MSGPTISGQTSLARIIRSRGMSQCELATRSGVSRETICGLCTGRKKISSGHVHILAALAWALEIEVRAFADLSDAWLPFGPHGSVPVGIGKATG